MGVPAGLSLLAVLLASYIKGVIGFGFPTISTPFLALFVDFRIAIVVLILPNLVMDGIQVLRKPGLGDTLRRHVVLYLCGVGGTFLGTRLLVSFSSEKLLLILGGFVLVFVAVNVSRLRLHVAPALERYLSPPIGLFAGVLGGVTNVPGTPLALYFFALGMDKAEFVRSIALSFLIYKAAQLASVIYFGLLTWPLFGLSGLATALGLGTFWLGLQTQDRVDQATFNRAVLGFLGLLGIWLVIRAVG
ncbi:MAG: sulfite exporter TauE/SafE family protein [Candidatus Rokubacteria bacterium]|nr:sulfite exporter TauE/SafE family protein [Candidatus Rokubacteria bacterium]